MNSHGTRVWQHFILDHSESSSLLSDLRVSWWIPPKRDGKHMETMTVVVPVVIEVTEEYHVAQARQAAQAVARATGFGLSAAFRVAISASELGGESRPPR
jgi:hypothetical protein